MLTPDGYKDRFIDEKISGHYINRDFAEDILIPGGEIISSYCPYME